MGGRRPLKLVGLVPRPALFDQTICIGADRIEGRRTLVTGTLDAGAKDAGLSGQIGSVAVKLRDELGGLASPALLAPYAPEFARRQQPPRFALGVVRAREGGR